MRKLKLVFFCGGLTLGSVAVWQAWKPLPDGLDSRGAAWPVAAGDVHFLSDRTVTPVPEGARQARQEIFENVFSMIAEATSFIVADFFLINDFAGAVGQEGAPLSEQLTDALVTARQARPDMPVILITDRFNTLYGAVEQPYFTRLREAGVDVVLTDLRRLRDSNLIYSPVWRVFLQWRDQPQADGVPNPVGAGSIGLSAFLELLNFKANHRKVLVTGHEDGSVHGLVASANPHSASVWHGNVALRFRGEPARDLLRSEAAVYRFSTGQALPEAIASHLRKPVDAPFQPSPDGLTLRILTEKAIARELRRHIAQSGAGDHIDIAQFYFAHIGLRRALAAAVKRGAQVRLLLDPNLASFGRSKNGIPNHQTAAFLHDRGVQVRWYRTDGEQFHSKMALFRGQDGQAALILGSANWTRRNLHNLNLETNIALVGPARSPALGEAARYFKSVWGDASGMDEQRITVSAPFEQHEERSLLRRGLYHVMERTGAGTF